MLSIFDHIQTVSKAKIGSKITSLPQEKLKQAGKEISFALELE
jgi:mRNA-degrading endonuclease toxin of MazEF toxin-antitoxin module